MRKRILFCGVLSGPGCGELHGNLSTRNMLTNKFQVSCVDTNLVSGFDGLEKVGKFGLKKIIKAIGIYKHFFKVFKSDIIYLVPGQTFGGILKFLPLALCAKFFKKRLIYHFHGSRIIGTFSNSSGVRRWLVGLFIRLSDVSFVLTNSIKDSFLKILPVGGQVVVLPNSVDSDCGGGDKLDGDVVKVLYFSNMMKEKGVMEFIGAATSLSKSNRFAFYLAGGGDFDVERDISDLASGYSNIHFVGFVDGEEKQKLLDECHVYVLPTYYPQEGLPISMLECMAYGQVVITCRQGGIPDVIEEDVNGYYVEQKSYLGIADCLLKLEDDRDGLRRMSSNNRNKIKEEFSEEAYREILFGSI